MAKSSETKSFKAWRRLHWRAFEVNDNKNIGAFQIALDLSAGENSLPAEHDGPLELEFLMIFYKKSSHDIKMIPIQFFTVIAVSQLFH